MSKTDPKGLHLAPDASEVRTEEILLGTLLRSPELVARAGAQLAPADFSSAGRAAVYEAIVACDEAGHVDAVNVTRWLREKDRLKLAGGLSTISSLTDGIPPNVKVDSLVRAVKANASRQKIVHVMNDAFERLLGGESGWNVATQLDEDLRRALTLGRQTEFVQAGLALPSTLEASVNAAGSENSWGLDTGFPAIDAVFLGLQPGDVWYLAARPSVGKSSLMLTILLNLAMQGRKTACFSLEMSVAKQIRRILSQLSGLNANAIRTGRLRPEQWALLLRAATQLRDLPLWMDDSRPMTIGTLKAKARRLHAEVGLDLIAVDYVQLVRSGLRKMKVDDQNAEITEVSHGLKDLAGELNIPVLGLSQMSRAIETGKDRRPQLSDLRGSGSLEQDADIVSFLWKQLDSEKVETGIVEHICEKSRDGGIGSCELLFLKHLSSFVPGEPVSAA